MTDFESEAEQAIDLIRSQNWKTGGTLEIDRPDAVSLFAQMLRAAHSAGVVEGAREAGDKLMASYDDSVQRIIKGRGQ